MVSGSLVLYSPPSFNLLDLPCDILGLIWDEKLKLEKAERRKSLIGKHGWRFDCIWGGEGREEKDANYKRKGAPAWEVNSYDPYFFLHFLEKGKEVEDCSVMFYEEEKIKIVSDAAGTPIYNQVIAGYYKYDLSSLTVYQVEDFFKMYFFYENLIEAICLKCGDDCYDDYKYEQMEEYNPFLDARDGDIKYGECEIELTLGKESNKLYEALTEAACEWAYDNFFENDNNNLYSPCLELLEGVIDDMDILTLDKQLDFDVVENFMNTKYDVGQLYEANEREFNCGLWVYLVKIGIDDPYSIIDYLKKEHGTP